MDFNLLDTREIAFFGAKLRNIREFRGLTRSQAAEVAGVSPSWLQKLETGKHLTGTPTPEKLLNYCNSLGVKIELNYNITLTGGKKNGRQRYEKLY